ncbi:MAG: hypothetical protein R2746_10620 [Acidimicrobiales bacterium]|nr:hypothetical protein [Actinomycetota bacterium]
MTTPADALRPLLYGDVSLDEWPMGDDQTEEPWTSFVRARRHLADGDQDLAARLWFAIAADESLEARNRLQAWHFLRSINIHPDEATVARQAWGVLVEVPVDDGLDVLAAYRVGGVRYLNHSGAATVLDEGQGGDDVLAALPKLLAAGQALADVLGPWTDAPLPELAPGQTRLMALTPGGPRFGQGPDEALRQEPLAESLFSAATELLVAVVALTAP